MLVLRILRIQLFQFNVKIYKKYPQSFLKGFHSQTKAAVNDCKHLFIVYLSLITLCICSYLHILLTYLFDR